MKKFRLLVYEDDGDWFNSFIFNIKPRLYRKDIELIPLNKLDSNTVMQDLEFSPDLIMVDYDLGTETGKEVIEQMEGDPQLSKTSIFLYSGGVTIDFLKELANKLGGGITCFTKDDERLQEAVISKG